MGNKGNKDFSMAEKDRQSSRPSTGPLKVVFKDCKSEISSSFDWIDISKHKFLLIATVSYSYSRFLLCNIFYLHNICYLVHLLRANENPN